VLRDDKLENPRARMELGAAVAKSNSARRRNNNVPRASRRGKPVHGSTLVESLCKSQDVIFASLISDLIGRSYRDFLSWA